MRQSANRCQRFAHNFPFRVPVKGDPPRIDSVRKTAKNVPRPHKRLCTVYCRPAGTGPARGDAPTFDKEYTMRVLVTGGSGAVGTASVAQLVAAGHRVR